MIESGHRHLLYFEFVTVVAGLSWACTTPR